MTFTEQQDFVRNLKGAAASVLWILVLSGRSLTGDELEQSTGYSDKPIARATIWLERRGIIQNNGRYQGWSLAIGAKQLDIFTKLLTGKQEFLPIPAPSLAAHSAAETPLTHNGIPEHETLSTSGNGQHAAVVGNIPTSLDSDRKYSDLDPLVVVVLNKQNPTGLKNNNKQNSRKYSDLETVLKLVGVRGKSRNLGRIQTPLILPLAWWFELDSMDWEPDRPGGWIYKRLKNQEEPPETMVKKAVDHLNVHGLTLPDDDKCPTCGKRDCLCAVISR